MIYECYGWQLHPVQGGTRHHLQRPNGRKFIVRLGYAAPTKWIKYHEADAYHDNETRSLFSVFAQVGCGQCENDRVADALKEEQGKETSNSGLPWTECHAE